MFAQFASKPENSLGRLYQEPEQKFRSVYSIDRDRIINSSAFRRLQYKTQVFVNHQGDHFRTRLTHSLEVAQNARWIASGLKCNQDLAEVISLAHDLGHSPFGHAGEHALNNKMEQFGGFSHNAHTLKLITQLESSYFNFEGLNLSWEMLEGVVKHNGAITDISKTQQFIGKYNQKHNLDLTRQPSIEAQISAIADDITYNNHDIEDGLRAELFLIKDLYNLPFVGEKFLELGKKYPNARREILVCEAKRKLIKDMVLDVIGNTKKNISFFNIKSTEDVRNCANMLVCFSKKMEDVHQQIKNFLNKKMYQHHKIQQMTNDANKIINGLFDFFIEKPNFLPQNFQENSDRKQLAVVICDYIAGMTDRFAIKEFNRIKKLAA